MYRKQRIGAILLMGGVGNRFGSEIPKQFQDLKGKKVYAYPLDTMRGTGFFDEIILVAPPLWKLDGEKVVEGGKTRQESCFLGLKAFTTLPEIVLIHDAVRPFVSEEILKSNLDGAIDHGAVDTCIPTSDTLVYAPNVKRVDTIPIREHYLRGQTPQTFRFEWLLDAHERAIAIGLNDVHDDCQLLLDAGYAVQIVAGSERNFKITTQLDFELAIMFLQKELI